MTESECLLDTLVAVLRRYHPHGALCESALRHHSDIDTLALIHERVLHLCLDLGARGSVSQFWNQIELALRPIHGKKIAWDELPPTIDKACREPVKGEFLGQSWEECQQADAALRDMRYRPPFEPKGHAARIERPHSMGYERRSRDD